MNNHPNPLLSKHILELIQQNDGKLTWFEIVTAFGIASTERRQECIESLRLLEADGIIRSEASDGVIRLWIVKNPAE